jgi:hypothetical protein
MIGNPINPKYPKNGKSKISPVPTCDLHYRSPHWIESVRKSEQAKGFTTGHCSGDSENFLMQ